MISFCCNVKVRTDLFRAWFIPCMDKILSNCIPKAVVEIVQKKQFLVQTTKLHDLVDLNRRHYESASHQQSLALYKAVTVQSKNKIVAKHKYMHLMAVQKCRLSVHSKRNHNNDTPREMHAHKIYKRQKQKPKKTNVQMHDEYIQIKWEETNYHKQLAQQRTSRQCAIRSKCSNRLNRPLIFPSSTKYKTHSCVRLSFVFLFGWHSPSLKSTSILLSLERSLRGLILVSLHG